MAARYDQAPVVRRTGSLAPLRKRCDSAGNRHKIGRIEEFRTFECVDPKPFLTQLIRLEARLARSPLVRTLRTHELKRWRETR
jgi:hypothetical protein